MNVLSESEKRLNYLQQ
ncbi:Protein of unknown function [Bacillus mycoides]|nr:Protein of unknown function [Bacillus mycoides]